MSAMMLDPVTGSINSSKKISFSVHCGWFIVAAQHNKDCDCQLLLYFMVLVICDISSEFHGISQLKYNLSVFLFKGMCHDAT